MRKPTRYIVSLTLWALVLTAFALPVPARTQSTQAPESAVSVLFVASETGFLNSALLEERLQERPEFRKLGLAITRNRAEADLVIEVRRSSFTTKFNYSVLDPRSGRIVGGGRVSSLFGTASGRIAKGVVKILARRPLSF